MRPLFPEIRPFEHFTLAVDPPHRLYVEQAGNPEGLPVVFLHGGPGAGCEPWQRRFFDPNLYRIILFDQRGAGRSTPHACLDSNTTPDLVADLERLRIHLEIDRWLVFGGSWGSTLALVYAQTHPGRVSGLILRGIFLGRGEELHWFYQDGANRLFPERWEEFIAPIPPAERDDLLHAYHRRLSGKNELVRMACAKAWARWDAHCSTLAPDAHTVETLTSTHMALALACIESHFFVHECFLTTNQILNHIERLADIPAVIVHGRYDIPCPAGNAWTLARAWPQAELHIIAQAGHAASEPGIVDALVTASTQMASRLR